MEFVMLTRAGGNIPLISPIFSLIVNLMGWIMDLIFRVTSSVGIVNIGLCIIIFTIVTRILMFPLSYKQAKSQKLMAAIQPELQAIQMKYRGREGDQQAMMQQQAEMKAVYEKYGTSMTGGCVQLLIQMPIIFALYRVILNIPAYVSSVKAYFTPIVDAIGGESAIGAVNTFAHSTEELTKVISMSRISGGEIATTDHIIDFLYHLNPAQWESFKTAFSQAADVISRNYAEIEKMNTFLGLNLASSPSSYGLTSIKAWIIPVLAGLSQYASTKLISAQSPSMDGNDQAAQTMKTMNLMMPLMSVFFCFSFASGIGIYWIASAVLMGVQQYFLNKHFQKMDVNAMLKENIAKANAKRARKGLPPINEQAAEQNLKKMMEKQARMESMSEAKQNDSREKMEKADQYYKTGSIAERARMVQQFEEKKKR